MTDEPPKPGGPRRNPANANGRPAGARPKRPPAAASRESRFIGFLVLGLGIIALLAVVMIALSSRNGAPDGTSATVKARTEKTAEEKALEAIPARVRKYEAPKNVAEDLSSSLPHKIKMPPKQEEKPELFFKRDPSLDAASMIGSWKAAVGSYVAVLDMDGQIYQIVMADPNNYGARLYSAGTYEVLEDMVTLRPQNTWPFPDAPKGQGIKYNRITTSPFPVVVALKGDNMFWQNPPESEIRVVPLRKLPVLLSENLDYLTWQRTK